MAYAGLFRKERDDCVEKKNPSLGDLTSILFSRDGETFKHTRFCVLTLRWIKTVTTFRSSLCAVSNAPSTDAVNY